MSDAKRDEKGRLLPGSTANPAGRPLAIREYQLWLKENCLDKAKEALLSCLIHEDAKVRMLALREVNDRLFGKSPQAVVTEDGKPLSFGVIVLPTEEK